VPAFYISGQIAAPFVSRREFAVWRNAWVIGTIATFLFGNIFYFLFVLALICIYAHTARAVSVALFVVLIFFAPPIKAQFGGLGFVNRTIDLNNINVLALGLLVPLLLAVRQRNLRFVRAFTAADRFVALYVLLRMALLFREPDIGIGYIRNMISIPLDILVPYFAFSRAVTTVSEFRKVLFAFVVGILPLALIGVFETAKHWLLYNPVIVSWRTIEWAETAEREGVMRASATAAPIVLGSIIIVAIGAMMVLRRTTNMPKSYSVAALVILSLGEVACLSRGPWVGTMTMLFIYFITSPNLKAHIARFILIGPLAFVLLLLTPFGDRVIGLMPFIGDVDTGSISYRQLLLEKSVEVIADHPFFGMDDFKSTPQMQALMQGQHIIDVVNSYLRVALDTGLVGLALFIGVFLSILIGLRRVAKFGAAAGEGVVDYARTSIAIMIGILITIGTVSSISFLPTVYWSFAGLCVALVRVGNQQSIAVARMAFADKAAR
jgi:hypothetical protein